MGASRRRRRRARPAAPRPPADVRRRLPVLYKAVGGSYALWFLIILAAGKIIACSLTIGIGGSGGVFAPSLFIGATSGMAFGEIIHHAIGPAAGQPALYAVVAMGAVFAAAARAPLTSLASVVEMTGDFTLTLPVMLAVAIATATSRALSYGTIYTTKLLRRAPTSTASRPPTRSRNSPPPTPCTRSRQRCPPSLDLPACQASRPPAPLTCPGGRSPGLAAGPVRHRVPHPGPAPARAVRTRRPARPVRRRGARTGLAHHSRCAAGCREPHPWAEQAHARTAVIDDSRCEASPDQVPTPLDGYQLVDMTVLPGSPVSRPEARQHHLATRVHSCRHAGRPLPAQPRPGHHPGSWRPRQPARPRSANWSTLTVTRLVEPLALIPPPAQALGFSPGRHRRRQAHRLVLAGRPSRSWWSRSSNCGASRPDRALAHAKVGGIPVSRGEDAGHPEGHRPQDK